MGISVDMKTLACKDIDPSSTCDYKSTGNTDEEVLRDMMDHAKGEHADSISGMSDEEMSKMMRPHIKEEAGM